MKVVRIPLVVVNVNILGEDCKIKCRKSAKLNVGFPTFFIRVSITIEVIVRMEQNNEFELRNGLNELIRLNIKPNFAALGLEYEYDYRTVKS